MKRRILTTLLALILITSLIPMEAMAKIKKVEAPSEVKSLISISNNEDGISDNYYDVHNYVRVTANGKILEIEGETTLDCGDVLNVNPKRVGSSAAGKRAAVANLKDEGDFYSFKAQLSGYSMSNGDYVLTMTMPQKTGITKTSTSPIFYKNCNFRVTNGEFYILQYNDIIEENARIRKKADDKYAPENYLSANLSDIKSICFRDPVTKKVASVTKNKVNYFKKVAKAITKNANSEYEKVQKIYEYIADNFYYDDIAFKQKTKQYIDPYRNLYNQRNKKKSANSQDGKVATVCVGYSAMLIALCRAEGIPARLVNGHHVSLSNPYCNWSTESGITTLDHWWAEVYVDDRWITVDPTPANSSKWNRSKNEWVYTGLTNYIFFDPTPEQLATSHLMFEIVGGKK